MVASKSIIRLTRGNYLAQILRGPDGYYCDIYLYEEGGTASGTDGWIMTISNLSVDDLPDAVMNYLKTKAGDKELKIWTYD